MVVSTTISRVEYSGNGSTTAFAYTFRIFADGDLKVYIVSSAGVATLKTLTTHYSVSGAGDASGGNVTMGSAPASGETLVIERSVSYTQSTDYVESDSFSAETHESALDRNTMLTQQNQRDIARSMRLGKGTADSVSVELPAPVASHFIKWNADADALESAIGTADQVTVTDFMATVLDDTTQAAAQTTLGLGTGDSPQFTGVNVGHATDTTVTRASAGDLNVEGNIVYRAGGTDVPVADGGTGASSLTDGGVLLGSGTAAITAMAVLGDGEFLVGDGSGDPVAESGATARTSLGLGTGDSPTFTTVTASTSIIPDAAGGADLGSTSAEWGDVYIADDKALKFGNDQDLTIEYDEDGLDTTRVVGAGGLTMSPHGTSSGNTTEMRFLELAANGNNYAGFKAPDSITGTSVYQLPAAFPASSKYLQSTDAGVLSWQTIASPAVTALNNATESELVTVGSTTTELDAESGLTWDGTTLAITGRYTASAQPMCLVRGGDVSNVTGDNTQYTLLFPNEVYDIGTNFSSDTYTFPVTGKYLVTAKTYVYGLTASHDRGSFGIVTSNYSSNGYWFWIGNAGASRDNNNAVILEGAMVVDADASDTCVCKLTIGGGSQVVDLGGADTQMSVTLLA
tara:strand:- start:370 stop:2253 length:1884 start_codon:yes stop_codon:yes gene_type:complete